MNKREKAYKRILDEIYPGLVVRIISQEQNGSYGLVLSGEQSITTSKGIPVIDYYHEAECELNNGYQTGDLYDMGVSYELQGWIEKKGDLHFEWENPGTAKLYIVDL